MTIPCDVKDMKLGDMGRKRLHGRKREMPVLRQIPRTISPRQKPLQQYPHGLLSAITQRPQI